MSEKIIVKCSVCNLVKMFPKVLEYATPCPKENCLGILLSTHKKRPNNYTANIIHYDQFPCNTNAVYNREYSDNEKEVTCKTCKMMISLGGHKQIG